MTEDQLTDLRLKQLEDQAVGAREVERSVDRLKIEVPRLELSIEKMEAANEQRHAQLHASLSRLHTRFDELAAEEHREQGAKAERAKLGRWGMAMIGAGTMIGGLLVGVASLILQH